MGISRGAWLLLLPLVACPSDCQSPAGPTAPGGTTTTSVEVIPPPIRVDAPFQWDTMAGYTAFALGHPDQTEAEVRSFVGVHMAHGWNTARVCAETEFWSGDPYYLVPKPRDLVRLEWLLNIFASIPGAQVLLIGDCTLKGPVPEEEKREWAGSVAQLAAIYANVAIETHNEPENCSGRGWGPHCPTKQDIAAHIAIYHSAGILYVTADDRLCRNDFDSGNIGFRYANVGAHPADFHPCRDYPVGSKKPWDPSKNQLQQLTNVNGMILLSETVAWGDDGECDGLRTCDKDRIQSYINRCAQVGNCRFVYHSVNGLGGIIPTFIPSAK